MIESKDIAAEINRLMLDYGEKLNASVAVVERRCTADELRNYRRAVGTIMGDMLLNIMNPIYARHPDLKPKSLD